ncbi:hypothetical protein [Nonomuraea antimicrobica]|uniref:hypothetical protein n=1 Tax=Nonomuraea antimicrobica TaxID=561173 RepID=UPI0031E5A54F
MWSEGLSVEEVARQLGADPAGATRVTLADLPVGFEGEDMPGDHDGILLIGEFGAWTLTLQIQWADTAEQWALESLSAGGGRAIGVSWHGGSGYRIFYAQDGEVAADSPMTMIPAVLSPFADGLPTEPDWDVPGAYGSPIAQMISTCLVVIGRVTGQEISRQWLEEQHTRYLIRRS